MRGGVGGSLDVLDTLDELDSSLRGRERETIEDLADEDDPDLRLEEADERDLEDRDVCLGLEMREGIGSMDSLEGGC